MKSDKMCHLVIAALEDLKAIDISIMDVKHLSDVTDFMIVCTGRSSRHVASLAENVATETKRHHLAPLSINGLTDGEWALVDLGDVIVHVMQAEIRALYGSGITMAGDGRQT